MASDDGFSPGRPRAPQPGPPDPPAGAPAYLGELATGVWRLDQAVPGRDGQAVSAELRRIRRHLDALRDVLVQAGVKIQDHTGAPFVPGLSLIVLAFQPTAGLDREVVLETLRPTVYLGDKRIQVGEVIVGRPSEAAPELPSATGGDDGTQHD